MPALVEKLFQGDSSGCRLGCRSFECRTPSWKGLKEEELRAARRAVKHPIRQTSLLGMTALASMAAQSVGQGDYLLKDPENSPVYVAAAAVATGQAGPSEPQFPGAARWAEDTARLGCRTRWNSHSRLLRRSWALAHISYGSASASWRRHGKRKGGRDPVTRTGTAQPSTSGNSLVTMVCRRRTLASLSQLRG
jgi:hypothetical protein